MSEQESQTQASRGDRDDSGELRTTPGETVGAGEGHQPEEPGDDDDLPPLDFGPETALCW